MLKIGKGLKKKKKSKKHKKGEEELFKPEEFEEYRRKQQQQAALEAETEAQVDGESSRKPKGLDSDEWKKFNALAADVDTLLQKTQTDLNRIKSTSFFQRKPPPKPEPPKTGTTKNVAEEQIPEPTPKQAQAESLLTVPQIEDFESESEYEDDEDDIFDTSFVDGVESGEIKLAYVPESPEQENAEDEFDPFDTTEADKIIKGPEVSKKGKKLVSIGSAVEVLTGRVDLSTCAIPRKSPRRGIVNLLLDQSTVDTNGNLTEVESAKPTPKSLLDDDDPNIPVNEPINLSVSLVIPPPQPLTVSTTPAGGDNKPNLSEFDIFAQQTDELDDEFASLAAESLKTVKPVIAPTQLSNQPQAAVLDSGWDAFGTDTQEDLEFPQSNERKHSSVSIHITDPSGQRESVSSEDLNALKPSDRDLLGGSTTDLSKLANQPIKPIEVQTGEDFDTFSDPFDTSIVDQINLPGKTELKFIEAELLGDTEPIKTTLTTSLSDPDFDPRDGEVIAPIEPILPTVSQTVGFVEKFEEDEEIIDPFDTSFVQTVAPGKEELKLIESELAELETQIPSVTEKLNKILSDSRKLSQQISPPRSLSLSEPPEEPAPDFLFVGEDVNIKALTPAVENKFVAEFDLSYVDPFDTSVASNILPGRAELKLLESELLESVEVPNTKTSLDKIASVLPNAFTPPRPRQPAPVSDLLNEPVEDNLGFKALTPEKDSPTKVDDIDPFDTSITNTLVPGKVELKLLESELIH